MPKKKSVDKKRQMSEPRPPVVVILGHVDHGKTTLLDTVRKTNVAAREAGGITQHVGAYVIQHDGKPMTLLDTPGHEAFSAMRSRGAQVADVAILVVAVDDGVQPQTRESITAIREAGIPFVVALNKIDKGNADVKRAKTELSKEEVLLEGWGGDVPNVEISAKEGTGVDELIGLVALVAEVAELRAEQDMVASGVVIEAHRDARRGPVATLLVKEGTLRVEDVLVAGAVAGKVKALQDFSGQLIQEAGPSTPTVILGLDETPYVGDAFRVLADEGAAVEVADAEASRRAFEQVIGEGEPERELTLILKADVVGSLEAIMGEFEKFRNEKVALRLAGVDTGEVTENDVKRAAVIGGMVVAFRVKTRRAISELSERLDVQIRDFSVIYELLDAVRSALEDRLPKRVLREEVGTVKLLATFKNDPPRQVIGGRVENGAARKDVVCEIEREGDVIARGMVLEVQQEKIAVDEVTQGKECGMLVKYESGAPAQVGDVAKLFTEQTETPKL